MIEKKVPGRPGDIPYPGVRPEMDPDKLPDPGEMLSEDPERIPEEDPFERPPEIEPSPGEGP